MIGLADGASKNLTFTRPQLATIFGKNPRTIAKWLDEGMPVASKGRGGRPSLYNLPKCVQWVIEQRVQALGGSGAELSPQTERALLDRKRREELEIKIQVRRGQLVEVDAVRLEYADLATAVKQRLRAIPDAVADQVTVASHGGPAAVKALLLARIDEALRELARGDDLYPPDTTEEGDEDEDGEPSEAIA